jgi:CRP-like cAMP-binding protein
VVSPELIRRYPFFAGLDLDQINTLAQAATERSVDEGHRFFREGDQLDEFYLLVEGSVAVVMEVPDREVAMQDISGQITGEMQMKDIVVSGVGTGDIFGWSCLVPPYQASAGAVATTPCRVVAFDGRKLLEAFDDDCRFGYVMTQRVTTVMRERLRDMRIESLSTRL